MLMPSGLRLSQIFIGWTGRTLPVWIGHVTCRMCHRGSLLCDGEGQLRLMHLFLMLCFALFLGGQLLARYVSLLQDAGHHDRVLLRQGPLCVYV
jgi:hypothetical protein